MKKECEANVTFQTKESQAMSEDQRLLALQAWLSKVLALSTVKLSLLSGDASFRRYFRVYKGNKTYVAMDAPPSLEYCEPYILISKTFRRLGLHTPEIYESDITRGFLLISDFGDNLYLDLLNEKTADELYQRALNDLLIIQRCEKIENYDLPSFDKATYLQEMNLFREWHLEKFLNIELTKEDHEILEEVFVLLIREALSQPKVCTHRDYHSRNLMLDHQKVGILDFQDALWGPITYDLLSLLRDCYIDWPPSKVEAWALAFQKRLLSEKLLSMDDPKVFMRWFDWIGLQRNLKCIGIFSRLKIRDQKSHYLKDIPRVIDYAYQVCQRYSDFKPLKELFDRYLLTYKTF